MSFQRLWKSVLDCVRGSIFKQPGRVACLAFAASGVLSVFAAAEYSFSYDASGRLVQVRGGDGQRIDYTYDAAGNLLNRTLEAFVDSDGDFMDDAWEMEHLGGLDRGGEGDLDGDGLSDLQEFLARTDPDDPASVLKIDPPTTASGVTTLTWRSVEGQRYRVEYKDDLSSSAWTALPQILVGQGTSTSSVDDTAPGNARRFYRVTLAP